MAGGIGGGLVETTVAAPLHARTGVRMISTCARERPVWSHLMKILSNRWFLKTSQGRVRSYCKNRWQNH
eukprot:1494632-Pyramimonas_sp.AAC.1